MQAHVRKRVPLENVIHIQYPSGKSGKFSMDRVAKLDAFDNHPTIIWREPRPIRLA
jgi:hypothetical protein